MSRYVRCLVGAAAWCITEPWLLQIFGDDVSRGQHAKVLNFCKWASTISRGCFLVSEERKLIHSIQLHLKSFRSKKKAICNPHVRILSPFVSLFRLWGKRFLRENWRNVEIQYMDVHCGRGQFSSNNHPLARWFHQWKSYLEIHGSTWIETRETRFVVLNLWSLHLVPYWQLMWVAYQVFLIHSVLLCSIIKDIICLSEYGTAVWRMKSRYYTNRLWKPSYSIRAPRWFGWPCPSFPENFALFPYTLD